MKKNKKDLVKGWLQKAERDLITAKRELSADEPFSEIICYHAQQSAEKYLKGYLVWNEIEFPHTHAIEDLVALASEGEEDFDKIKSESSILTPYEVEVRYPEFEEPRLQDAKQAIEIASRIKKFVKGKLPENF